MKTRPKTPRTRPAPVRRGGRRPMSTRKRSAAPAGPAPGQPPPPQPSPAQPASGSKGAAILAALQQGGGASICELMTLTGWQAHSVRGYLSATVRKRLGLTIAKSAGPEGLRYRLVAAAAQAEPAV